MLHLLNIILEWGIICSWQDKMQLITNLIIITEKLSKFEPLQNYKEISKLRDFEIETITLMLHNNRWYN